MQLHHNAPRPSRKRLAIVGRVSTEEQEEYGTSVDDQVDKGKRLAQLHEYTFEDRSYTEGGHIYKGDESGALPLAQRPIMRRLIADARAHRFEAVCFTKIDRIARRLKYILEIWDALDEAGIVVHVIEPTIDTSTHIGRLIRNILGSIAEFERDTILDRTMGGRRRKIAKGENFLPKGKYGYTYTCIDCQSHKPGRVTVNEQTAAVVRRIFERRAAGVSFERIALELTAAGIPRPSGGQPWRHSTIDQMLGDSAYMGSGLWGRQMVVRTENGRRTLRSRTKETGAIEVEYPPIISRELWHAANRVTECAERHPVRATVESYLLRGLVRCIEHDRIMCGSVGRTERGRRYMCSRLLVTGKRLTHQLPSRALDEAVWADIRAFLEDPTRGLAAARRLAEEDEARLEVLAAQRLVLTKRLTDLDEAAAELLRLGRRRTISAQDLDRSMAEVDKQREGARAELATLEAQIALAASELPQAAEIERICQDLADGLRMVSTAEERRELLESLQVHVFYTGCNADGYHYTIEGIVPELTTQGTIALHTYATS
jgi:site-specific DNA recombinase